MDNLPDIQEQEPIYHIPINRVGIENLELPFDLLLRNGKTIRMIANVSLSTDLDRDKKGISMSRLLIAIEKFLYEGLNWDVIKNSLDYIATKIESDNSYVKFDFSLPINKISPLSKNVFPMFYKCCFEGFLQEKEYKFLQHVEVQYSSYCPCSAALSENLEEKGFSKGFPHAQRSFAKIILNMFLENRNDKYLWLEDIIDIVNINIHTQPYPIIKRIDEQEIAKIAANNPLFVEDAIRIISYHLDKLMGNSIIDWIVKCKHEESIHAHEAFAVNYANVKNGFGVNDI